MVSSSIYCILIGRFWSIEYKAGTRKFYDHKLSYGYETFDRVFFVLVIVKQNIEFNLESVLALGSMKRLSKSYILVLSNLPIGTLLSFDVQCFDWLFCEYAFNNCILKIYDRNS